MTVSISTIGRDDAADLRAFVDIVNSVTPDMPTSLEEIRWADATYPDGARFLARVSGRPVGAGSVGRVYVHEAAYQRFWLGLQVLPSARRHGLGTALWRAASGVAGAAGKTGLETAVSEAHPEGIAFLEHRGFRVFERTKTVRLDLRGAAPPPEATPAGIILTTLAARPDLAGCLHVVALEAYPDIPHVDAPVWVGSLHEFLARDVRRDGVPPDALAIALDEGSGEVVGWASLMLAPGSTTLAWHDMTAVRPGWRRRGVATALKLATIRWAIAHGLEALETGNDEANRAMRALNARLGYGPVPDVLGLRGPLAPPQTPSDVLVNSVENG